MQPPTIESIEKYLKTAAQRDLEKIIFMASYVLEVRFPAPGEGESVTPAKTRGRPTGSRNKTAKSTADEGHTLAEAS